MKELLITFDTSTLLYYFGLQNIRDEREEAEEELVLRLRKTLLKNERKVFFKTSASQVERRLIMCNKNTPSSRKRTAMFEDKTKEAMDKLHEGLQKDGFENYENKIGNHAEELDKIQKRQLWMANNPDRRESHDWLVKKGLGTYVTCSASEKRERLSKLKKSARSGRDTLLLAQAAVLAKKCNVFFISNDGDHTTLDWYMKKITGDMLWVMYPNKVEDNLKKLRGIQE